MNHTRKINDKSLQFKEQKLKKTIFDSQTGEKIHKHSPNQVFDNDRQKKISMK